MFLLPLILGGCGGPPSSIPRSPGTLSEENLAEVMTVAVPDAPYLMWAMMLTLKDDMYRSCPTITPTSTGTVVTGNDCQDSAGLTWTGKATLSETSSGTLLAFNNFGYSGVIDGAWAMNGQILVTRNDDYSGYHLDTRVWFTSAAQSGAPDATRDYWLDSDISVTNDSSDYWYADNWSGEVGVSDIGLFDIVGARTEIASMSGCEYGAAGFGRIALEGANRADFTFNPSAVTVIAPPPATYDTGYYPYGDSGDSGDTGDTGDSGDSGDTGDSGGADTDPTTTDEDTICGCAEVTLGSDGGAGSLVDDCMIPSRKVAWPFVNVY